MPDLRADGVLDSTNVEKPSKRKAKKTMPKETSTEFSLDGSARQALTPSTSASCESFQRQPVSGRPPGLPPTPTPAAAPGGGNEQHGLGDDPRGNSAYPSEDAAHPSEDAAYPGEDAAYPSEDAAHLSEDGVHLSEDGVHPSEAAAYPSEVAAYPNILEILGISSEAGVHPSEAAAHPSEISVHPSEDAAHLSEAGIYFEDDDFVESAGEQAALDLQATIDSMPSEAGRDFVQWMATRLEEAGLDAVLAIYSLALLEAEVIK
jgi:hypothetical protein